VERALDILRVPDLADLAAWIKSFKPRQPGREWQPPTRMNFPIGDAPLNPRVIDVIARTLAGQGFKQHGDWLHGSCIHPERHKNGDRNPSFGFNTQSGYGHCYVCGTMLAKEVCEVLNIDPDQVGGLVERPQPLSIQTQGTVKRQPAPDKPKDPPPAILTDYKLPDWLQQYMSDKLLLRKRFIIETINDQLKNQSQIEHSRHRSLINFVINVVAGLIAYMRQPKKPTINWSTREAKALALLQ
jgi:hypothetical protein